MLGAIWPFVNARNVRGGRVLWGIVVCCDPVPGGPAGVHKMEGEANLGVVIQQGRWVGTHEVLELGAGRNEAL